ncbi:MAG: sulfite exporter TauE/SafE family protein, partial [Chloroflexi bacterium]
MAVGLLMLAGGVMAGVFGSLLGLGGGILIVPLLTIGFGLPLREAVGVSLICVIVTSGAAAGVYLERHVANLRLGMTLELFTAIGALIGGLVAFLLSEQILAALFSVMLVYVAVSMIRGRDPEVDDDAAATEPPAVQPFGLTLDGPGYAVHGLGRGAIGSIGAGVVSALLGIGGGLIKVPVMHLVMGVPLRVATA